MKELLIIVFSVASIATIWQFLRKYKFSPVWLMLSVWFLAIAISQLHLSTLELAWPGKFWYLIFVSLGSFVLGALVLNHPRLDLGSKKWIPAFAGMGRGAAGMGRGAAGMGRGAAGKGGDRVLSFHRLQWLIYFLFLVSLGGLFLFYQKAGNFPLLAPDPDAFRFTADEQVPGLINYCAQLARIFIPMSFFLFFYQGFKWRQHGDLVAICMIGACFLILFASRTQIFFIDLWVMALYLLMRKPNLRQAFKFYPFFILVSIIVLAAVPIIRQYRSYGPDYLGSITGIDTSHYNGFQKALVPIYVGVSFNQQALLHAWQYYQTHELQHGRVSLDPFTNILGLDQFKSNYDLGAIFYSWWNTGTYLFPFVQDFGEAAFYFIPFVIAGILTLVWKYWQGNPNFLSINLYAYAVFFIVMTVYLSFTVRAEMYLDLALLFVGHLFVSQPSPPAPLPGSGEGSSNLEKTK